MIKGAFCLLSVIHDCLHRVAQRQPHQSELAVQDIHHPIPDNTQHILGAVLDGLLQEPQPHHARKGHLHQVQCLCGVLYFEYVL
jgi:hypothetical protein